MNRFKSYPLWLAIASLVAIDRYRGETKLKAKPEKPVSFGRDLIGDIKGVGTDIKNTVAVS